MHRLKDGAVEWREVEGEVVALDLSTSSYLGINKTGAVVWPLLAAGAEEADLVQVLMDRFEVDEETAAADVRSLIEELERRNLLAPEG